MPVVYGVGSDRDDDGGRYPTKDRYDWLPGEYPVSDNWAALEWRPRDTPADGDWVLAPWPPDPPHIAPENEPTSPPHSSSGYGYDNAWPPSPPSP